MKRLAIWMGLIIFFAGALPAFGQQTAEEYFSKGVGLYEAHNYNEAVTAFEKALEIKPDYAEACYNLAITYWQQKQYQKVSEKLQKVMELAPGSDVAKKAERDIKNLKTAGISLGGPKEKEATVEEEGAETSPITKSSPSEKPTATLPELMADLRFGPTSKRIAAAQWLGFFSEKEAVETLGEVTGKSEELPEIRVAAVESLGKIALPSAIPFLQTALEAQGFPAEGKQAAIQALNAINTTESLKVILSAWAGAFPGGLSDQNVVEMIRKKGREEFADIIRPAYFQTTGEKKMYMALALGILKDATGVPFMVNRLQEDYPGDASPKIKISINQPFSPGMPGMPGMPGARGIAPPTPGMPGMPPGMPGGGGIAPPMPGMPGMPRPGMSPTATPILKGQTTVSEGWSRKDETGLRVEIIDVLGICAGANQKPFLTYLSKNDQEKKVKEAALKAVTNLESRIASSTESYQKGAALAKEGKITEAIPLLRIALKENPDAPYAEEIKKLQARFNYDQALVLLKENKNEEAVTLLQSALELDPEAPFRKDAEDRLAKLQPAFRGMGVPGVPGMPGAPGMPGMPPGMNIPMPPGMNIPGRPGR